MTRLRTIASNTALLSFAQVLNPITSVLLISAIARLQGVEVLGKYSLVLAIFYMAVNIATLGLGVPITRAVSIKKDQASDYLIVSGVLGLTAGCVAILGMRILVVLFDYPPDVIASANLLAWAVIPSVLILNIEAIYLAFEKAKMIAGLSIAENTCKVFIGITLLAMGKSVLDIFFAVVSLRFVFFFAYMLLFTTNISKITPRFNWDIARALRQVSPIFTSNLMFNALLGRVDLLILSKLTNMADVGMYSAALRIVQITALIPTSYKRAVLPVFCDTFYKAAERCRIVLQQSVVYMTFIGVGVALTTFLTAEFLIAVLYGNEFGEAVLPLRILALLLIANFLTPVFASVLFASNHELVDLFSNVVRTAVLVILCLVAIPIAGTLGAAIALVLSELVQLVIVAWFVRKKCIDVNVLWNFTWPLVGAACGYAVSLLFPPNPVLRGIVALVTYIAVVLFFHSKLRNDVAALARAGTLPMSRLIQKFLDSGEQ